MADALPCLVCGRQLRRVFDDVETQPADGIVLDTSGNYGSRAYDSMNGNFIVMNLCDACLITAGELGRVVTGRRYVPVETECLVQPGRDAPLRLIKAITGSHAIEPVYVPWVKGTPDLDSTEFIEAHEIDQFFDKENYRWNLDKDQMIRQANEVIEYHIQQGIELDDIPREKSIGYFHRQCLHCEKEIQLWLDGTFIHADEATYLYDHEAQPGRNLW